MAMYRGRYASEFDALLGPIQDALQETLPCILPFPLPRSELVPHSASVLTFRLCR